MHFRNIRGGFGDFVETFPDVGSVNMIDAIKTYREVSYLYMLMPDHVPTIPGGKERRTESICLRVWLHPGFDPDAGLVRLLLQKVGLQLAAGFSLMPHSIGMRYRAVRNSAPQMGLLSGFPTLGLVHRRAF